MPIQRRHDIDYALVTRLAQQGMPQKAIAEVLAIPLTTFNNYLSTDERLRDAVDQGYADPTRRVEQAHFQRAVGFHVAEVTEVMGQPVKQKIKFIPGSVAAQVNWLRNRDPDRWNVATNVNATLSFRDQVELATTRKQPVIDV